VSSLFQECPEAKRLFGFPVDVDVHSSTLVESQNFIAHSTYFVELFDTAFNMLGPDTELLTEIMQDLGGKHVRLGVTLDMFPIVGEALVNTLAHILGKNFTPAVKAAYVEVYTALSTDIIRAYNTKLSPS